MLKRDVNKMNVFNKEPHPKVRAILIKSSLSFLRNGYHGVSMRDIAEQVSLQKGSLYHYFPSKVELATTIVQHLEEHASGQFFTYMTAANADNMLAHLFHPDKDDINVQSLAILPLYLHTANNMKLQQAIYHYYQKWKDFFSRHEMPANTISLPEKSKFYSWLGYWLITTI